MQQVKLFKGIETELQVLEADVNSWIKQGGVRVLSITGNIAPQGEPTRQVGEAGSVRLAPSDILLIVTYETD